MIQNPIVVALATHSGDLQLAKNLLSWIASLGKNEPHTLLIVVDETIATPEREALKALGKKSFGMMALIPSSVPCTWKPNQMFLSAAKWLNECSKMPWLWLEPDATPLKEGWLDAISEEYALSPMKLLGPIVKQNTNPALPGSHLTGTAVYSPDTWELISENEKLRSQVVAWDMELASAFVPRAKFSNTIAHFYGKKDLAPHFVEKKSEDDPENFITLDVIPKSAVLFHRVKDGSLINLLKKKNKTPAAKTE